jgi:apolipoprotein D and lipocalin family protein
MLSADSSNNWKKETYIKHADFLMRMMTSMGSEMKQVIMIVAMGFVMFGCAATAKDKPTLTVVDLVDLERYLGKWYEIASYPAWFQKGCTGSTAEYSLLPDGRIQVINSCRKGGLDGKLKESKGKAEVVDTVTNAKLKVWFFWPFKGNYWIIELDPDYQWAVVGEPSRKYLWILSRTPTMDEAIYQEILGRLPQKCYDPAGLRKTAQIGN